MLIEFVEHNGKHFGMTGGTNWKTSKEEVIRIAEEYLRTKQQDFFNLLSANNVNELTYYIVDDMSALKLDKVEKPNDDFVVQGTCTRIVNGSQESLHITYHLYPEKNENNKGGFGLAITKNAAQKNRI